MLALAAILGALLIGTTIGYRSAKANRLMRHLVNPGDCALCRNGIRHDEVPPL